MKKVALIFLVLFVLAVFISLLVILFQKNLPVGDRIALIRIEGPIIDSTATLDEMKDYVKDSSIKAIVLRIDSPGGA